MATVLLTDAGSRATLAAVRSLGKAGHITWVCSSEEAPLAGASRFAAGHQPVSDPLQSPGSFVEDLARLIGRLGVEVLVPITEASALAILGHADRFSGIRIPLPDFDTFTRISDKALTLQVAEEVGIAVPEQVELLSPDDLAKLDFHRLGFPLVIKPARSVSQFDGKRKKWDVRHAKDAAALRSELASLPVGAFPVLLQRRIVGPGVGIFLLLWDHQRLGVFSHRRIREFPPSGGGSVYREGIAADPELVRCSQALLERFGWRGVAMVEFKIERETGVPYLMEVNGRFWGSLQLAVDSGVDFPRLLVDAALGRGDAPPPEYRVGVRSRWWWGDVDHLLARVRSSDEVLAVPADAPGRATVVLDFLKLWRPGDRSEVFRIEDPMPFFRESTAWIRKRLLRRSG